MDGCGREVDPYYMIAGDLRKHFPGVQANHDVATILKDNDVVTKDMTFDCESACFYAY